MNILITGGTGFLGKYLLNILNNDERVKSLIVLTRALNLRKTQRSLSHLKKVILIKGDITNPEIFEESNFSTKEIEKIDTVIHLGALYNLESSYSDAYLNNVVGTQNIIHFIKSHKNIKSFFYTSTIAVSGDYKGDYRADNLDLGQKFTNAYAKTKFLSELMVREELSVPTIIFRPGVVVGDSKNGNIEKIDGPYYLLFKMAKIKKILNKISFLKVIPFPFSENALMHVIPVDECAKAMGQIILSGNKKDKLNCYHLVSKSPLIADFVKNILKFFGLKVKLLPLQKRLFYSPILRKVGLPVEMLHYMYQEVTYNVENLNVDYPEVSIKDYSDFKDIFIKYLKREIPK